MLPARQISATEKQLIRKVASNQKSPQAALAEGIVLAAIFIQTTCAASKAESNPIRH
jgi:hypothetical protein